MAGLVASIPFPLSGRTGTAAAATYALTDIPYNIAIAGMPFLTAISDERVMTRSMAPIRKDQFDNQQIPGEQSLASWWLRSQATFIGGAGILYQDPSNDNQYAIRYDSSAGVNPWTNGSATLLNDTSARIADGTSDNHYVLGWNDGTDRYWSAVGNVLRSDTGSAITTITWGGANTIRSLTSDGTRYYAADNVNIYRGTGNGAGAALAATGTTNVVVRWVKGRLMLGQDNLAIEVDNAGTKTTRFTHLNPSWIWTDFAEGTNAIYASGYAGSQSSIYKFVLSTTGDVPTLTTGGVLTAQLPLGERVLSLSSYLGTFVGIGTSRGFRVGQIDDNGDIVYGPLLFEISAGVRSIVGFDRFFFVGATAGISGSSGLYRVDLGQPIQNNDVSPSIRFAYATDLQAGATGAVSGVTLLGNSNRMVFSVVGQGALLESATSKVATGTLTTGRIRYNTLEPKIFKFISVKTPTALLGSVGVSVIEVGGGETSIITVSEGSATLIENVILTVPPSAAEWVKLKFTLGRSAGTPAQGGEINGWQLKSIPGATRQRIFTIPLLCADFEKDLTGQRVGYEGRTADRLNAFEQVAQRGDTVSFQDLANGTTYLVIIDEYRFEQSGNPGNNSNIYGGYLWVSLRTVADVVTT